MTPSRRELLEALRACRGFLTTPGAIADLTSAVHLVRVLTNLLDRHEGVIAADGRARGGRRRKSFVEERARTIRCDLCGADAGEPCRTDSDDITRPHKVRITLALSSRRAA